MAGFLLGGSGGSQQQRGDQQGGGGGIPPSESFFLYGGRGTRSEDVVDYTRGFELWQQHQIQREHQLYSTAGYPDELPSSAARSMRGALGASGSGGGISCQDCGNQAKKDCSHLRCRTCCKSRGFQCATHVKSTWVPAAKRRERQQQLAAAAVQHDQRHRAPARAAGEAAAEGSGGGGGEPSKRPREITPCTRIPTVATTTTYGGSLDPESFPPEVSAPAVFRCVRVSHVDEADDVYAYQTAVSIGGHVFKGLLYDHGPEAEYPSPSSSRYQLHHGEGSSSPAAAAAAITNVSAGDAAIATTATTAAVELLEPYPTPLSAFMAGTQFFPHQHRP